MDKKRRHMYMVWNSDSQQVPSQYNVPSQLNFDFDKEYLVSFIIEDKLSGGLLSYLLRSTHPHYLIDLRSCPRFDISGYSRKKAFFEFEHYGAEYFCLSASDTSEKMDVRINSLINRLNQQHESIIGPIIVLIEDTEIINKVTSALPKPKNKKEKWSIAVEA